MKILRNLFRIITGLVFVFSGFVKGIDPLGTVYRMNDYFTAFSMPWATQFSPYLTIFLCALEFILGVSLLFNLWIRKTVWILIFVMLYFTILTFFDAVYNIVPDCGCFGDALKLSNVATFVKNLVLMGIIIPIFGWRKKYRSALPALADAGILTFVFILFTGLSVYCYTHLPLIDFMGWKEGNTVNRTTALPVKFYVTYKNKNTGEEKEYVAPDYPWNDSIWLSQWIFVRQRVVDPNDRSLALKVEDEAGNDLTPLILNDPGYHFILVATDLHESSLEGMTRILPLYKKAMADGLAFTGLTATLPAEMKKFRMDHGIAIPFLFADDVVLKTMNRSNPGLILLDSGKVIAKWPWRNFPDYEEVRKRYMQE